MPPMTLPLAVLLATLLVGSPTLPQHNQQPRPGHHGFMLRATAEGRVIGDDTDSNGTSPSASGRDTSLEHRQRAEAQQNRAAENIDDRANGGASGGDDDNVAAGVVVTTRGAPSAPVTEATPSLRGTNSDPSFNIEIDINRDIEKFMIDTAVTYEEGSIANIDYEKKWYQTEAEAQSVCSNDVACKGYWKRNDPILGNLQNSVYFLLNVAGSNKFSKNVPHWNVLSVKVKKARIMMCSCECAENC